MMARIRTIKPAFFTSQTIASLPLTARLTFIGLWTYVDDDGRGRDDVRLVKAELWPLDDRMTTKRVDDDLATLSAARLIQRYEVDGRRYLSVRAWHEHQKINRPQKSKFPPPGFSESSVIGHGTLTEPSLQEGKGMEGKGDGREQGWEGKDISSPCEEQRAEPSNGESGQQQPERHLVDALVAICRSKSDRVYDDAVAVVRLLRQHLDARLVEECITYCGKLRSPVQSPRFMLSTMEKWGQQRGVAMPRLELAS